MKTAFLLMGDENFATPLRYGLVQLAQLYPESPVYFYDWGVSLQTKKQLQQQHPHIQIVDWKVPMEQRRKSRSTDVDFRHRVKKSLMINLLRHALRPGKLWIKRLARPFLLVKQGYLDERTQFEGILDEKVAAAANCSAQVGDCPMVWLDADAILIQRLDEVFANSKMDVGVTVRRAHEISFQQHNCQVYNVGVMFFGENSQKRQIFLNHWLANTAQTTEYCREQTALVRLLEQCRPQMCMPGENFQMQWEGESINFQVFSCDLYNFNWIEELFETPSLAKSIKIIHFKAGRHLNGVFQHLWEQLANLQIVRKIT